MKSIYLSVVLCLSPVVLQPAMAQEYLIKAEIYNNVIVPCTLQGAAKGDTALADKFLEGGKDAVDSYVDSIYNVMQYTEAESDRAGAYPVWLYQCLAMMQGTSTN